MLNLPVIVPPKPNQQTNVQVCHAHKSAWKVEKPGPIYCGLHPQKKTINHVCIDGDCPEARFKDPDASIALGRAEQAARKAHIARVGRRLWKALHRRKWWLYSIAENIAWLLRWRNLVPSYGCSCQADWDALVAADPPPLHDPQAMPYWTWGKHEEINAKTGKPGVSYCKAAGMYGWGACGCGI